MFLVLVDKSSIGLMFQPEQSFKLTLVSSAFVVLEKGHMETVVQDKMARHRHVHSGTKPWACTVCPYRTYEKGHYVKHARIHTDERPFHCQICPYK